MTFRIQPSSDRRLRQSNVKCHPNLLGRLPEDRASSVLDPLTKEGGVPHNKARIQTSEDLQARWADLEDLVSRKVDPAPETTVVDPHPLPRTRTPRLYPHYARSLPWSRAFARDQAARACDVHLHFETPYHPHRQCRRRVSHRSRVSHRNPQCPHSVDDPRHRRPVGITSRTCHQH
jgi:hypothetical protein